MPEICEVSHITDQLFNLSQSSSFSLKKISILGGRYKRHDEPVGWDIIKDNLPLKWNSVNCKGKFIFFTFQTNYGDKIYMGNTLAMTGCWSKKPQKHSHILFEFVDDCGKLENLYFNDIRCFGTITFYFYKDCLMEKLRTIGKSWLTSTIDRNNGRRINISLNEFFIKLDENPYRNICKFLMDQTKLSGIGNYLLSEVLYDSGICPWFEIKNINRVQKKKLYESISKIILDSYGLDGVSLKDYNDLYEEPGEYQNCLKVFQREFDPEGRKVVRQIGPHGRSIHWVPDVQIRGRTNICKSFSSPLI